MKRILITSPMFTGEAEVFYRDDGTLVKIDCTECQMDWTVMYQFKAQTPATLANLEKGWKDLDITAVEGAFIVTFDMWWKKYNKKINKARCIMLFDKLNKTEQVASYYGIAPYDKYLTDNKWRTKADPETYLRNKYWENEYK